MKVIDAHVHLYPPDVNGDPVGWAGTHGEPHWSQLSTRCRRDGRPVQSFPSCDELVHAMDLAGVQRAVLQGWYWNRPETCAVQNHYYAACIRAHPDRLSAFAAFHPGMDLDVRWLRDQGFLGLGELSPHSQGYGIGDPTFRRVLTIAAELQLPITLHVTDPNSREFPGRVATPLDDFKRLARECPLNTFILAHWGGLLPLRDLEMPALANVYYDTAASPLLYDATVWRRFVAVVGAERVLFGSDFPLNLYPKADAEAAMIRFVEEARSAGLEAKQLQDILGGNAARLLRL